MNYNVVVVDDDDIILFLHRKILQSVALSEESKSFNSAQKFLDYIASIKGDTRPVLLFLDVNMPVMDGWGLLDVIHEEGFCHPIEVIMVTSSVDQEDKDKAAQYAKIVNFVEKPFSKSILANLNIDFD
ncbi:response regulator [Flavobacterium sp. 14A]|uniref:response regulator n=1 Tax=Flavobacterium sp. 14A TaxID=2735896 RepID=UPI00156D5F82|nr:response regulator [Flavobacterium sp. 14A]NRT13041.1 CheY-like chemotaxis protein [Flavobacterium sp. 14A]